METIFSPISVNPKLLSKYVNKKIILVFKNFILVILYPYPIHFKNEVKMTQKGY